LSAKPRKEFDCNNKCGKKLYWGPNPNDSSKVLPYEVANSQLHKCPNAPSKWGSKKTGFIFEETEMVTVRNEKETNELLKSREWILLGWKWADAVQEMRFVLGKRRKE